MDMQDGWRWCNQCYRLAYGARRTGPRGDGACLVVVRDELTKTFTADRSSVLHPSGFRSIRCASTEETACR